ncbi:MAG TPA: hypothetical protein VGE98_10410, partial [Thermoanaerobaculia bacterium]
MPHRDRPVSSRGTRRSAIATLLLFALLAALTAGVAGAQPTRNGALPAPLPLFPPDNWWNVDISSAPVDMNSNTYLTFIGLTRGLHPDFGGDDPDTPPDGIFGMPYIVVPGTQPLVLVTFVQFGSQSDAGAPGKPAGYPIPTEAKTQSKWIEGGTVGGCDTSDCHMLIVDRDNRILYELWQAHWNSVNARWEAGSGAVYQLDGNARRPDGWTSADAAGLAILPGLVRYDEAFGTAPIRHAFRMTVSDSNGHAYPASHDAGTQSGAPPMGARLRLKANKDISGFTPEVQRIFQAMKTYGLIVADNGSSLYIQGTYDTRWDNGVLNPAFGSLKGSDFDVITLGWKPTIPVATPAIEFYTVDPCRLIDTRNANGPYGGPAVPAGTQRVVVPAGQCGIPSTARALSANVTVVNAGAGGTLRFFAGDATPGNTLTIAFRAGQTRSNNLLLKLATS